ncbi:hypothetical protein Fcan01_05315 [Folsomia candida]|uniref:Uncharacterized protein n=1 Tax=Folsomia candida TaxID=158441 RepID=A0A226EQ87_FOLCA|nr:hypothetical protein Fcan01_05315 [Folsomia candida]
MFTKVTSKGPVAPELKGPLMGANVKYEVDAEYHLVVCDKRCKHSRLGQGNQFELSCHQETTPKQPNSNFPQKSAEMKVCAQLVILAAVAVAVFSAPENIYKILLFTTSIQANWPEVERLAAELHTLVSTSILTIRTTANDDNPTVGQTIGEKLDAASVEATVILEAAMQEIADRTLTVPTAQGYLQGLQALLMQLQQDLQADVNQLSLNAQNTIRSTFASAYNRAEEIAYAIYAALEA